MFLSPNINIKSPPTHCKLLKGENGTQIIWIRVIGSI